MNIMKPVYDGAVWRRDEAQRLFAVEVFYFHVVQRQWRHAVLVEAWMRQHLKRVADLPHVLLLLLLLLLRVFIFFIVVVVVVIAGVTCNRKQTSNAFEGRKIRGGDAGFLDQGGPILKDVWGTEVP